MNQVRTRRLEGDRRVEFVADNFSLPIYPRTASLRLEVGPSVTCSGADVHHREPVLHLHDHVIYPVSFTYRIDMEQLEVTDHGGISDRHLSGSRVAKCGPQSSFRTQSMYDWTAVFCLG